MVAGPSFAREVAASAPTALLIASTESEDGHAIAYWFHTPTTRVYYNADPTGVQLGGAIKNVIAVATGISDGLGYGANARSAIITRGLSELTRLGITLGGDTNTFMGLTGVGDLVLTCTDDKSRNRRFGLAIGSGKSIPEAIKTVNQEIEAINTTAVLYQLSLKHNIDMPITRQVYRVLCEGVDPTLVVRELLQKIPKQETD